MPRKPYTGPTFKERVALNEQQLCVSCKKNYRASISKVCTKCQRKLSFYGDAKAGGLPMRRLSRKWIGGSTCCGVVAPRSSSNALASSSEDVWSVLSFPSR